MKKDIFQYILAYVIWFAFIGLGIVMLIVSRMSLIQLLNQTITSYNFLWLKQIDVINQFYFFFAGIVLFILLIIVEAYLMGGVRLGKLFQRVFRVMGIEILCMALVIYIYLFSVSYSLFAMNWILPSGCLVLGGLLLWLSLRKPRMAAKA